VSSNAACTGYPASDAADQRYACSFAAATAQVDPLIHCIGPGAGYDAFGADFAGGLAPLESQESLAVPQIGLRRFRRRRAPPRTYRVAAMSSSLSMPVVRSSGRCLVVASAACQAQPVATLQRMSFDVVAMPDPYGAMVELSRRPLVYRAVVLSLQSLYREELLMIATVKRRLPHLEVWLTQTGGREAALAEAMRLGADGLLAEDGLHRTAAAGTVTAAGAANYDVAASVSPISAPPAATESQRAPTEEHDRAMPDDTSTAEPVLTADELRALLQEQPSMPPSAGED
jgi:hypothetical protein